MAEAKQSSSPGSMYGVASGLKASSQPDNGTASKGFDGLATLWSRVTGKEQDAPDEPAPATPPIKITPAAEAINPFPTLRVVHPALAGKLATAPRVLPARAGDQLEKRALEKRPGDLVERRAGDLP